ncbi:short-chain dehydrogenase TIC 32, chloroplastic-like [Curcuma longa]|uniref:short-chain dehydrogenase TIC 32, chloroplastic-like n=1 Tax=Curcuma longa TaxID=136217 RepID=UPI003D9FAFD1
MGYFREATGIRGPSGFSSRTTAEQVTDGIDASGRTVIITGGSSGIGAETARVMALRGAHVVIGARNLEAADAVKQNILQNTPSAKIDIIELELSSQKSVRAFADKFLAMNLPLHILINNAGVMNCPFSLSEDGIELQFATNHIGHFLLTNLLLDKIKSTAEETGIEGRIVILSSGSHMLTYREGIRFDKINDKKAYNSHSAYGQSKLANILHAKELAKHLKEEGVNVTANAVHPGQIKTNLMRHSVLFVTTMRIIFFILWKNIPQGAATSCYVALHPSAKGVSGEYFADCNIDRTTAHGRDEGLAKKLWEFSETLIK